MCVDVVCTLAAYLWICDAAIPQHIVRNDDAARSCELQELQKIVPVHALVAICTQAASTHLLQMQIMMQDMHLSCSSELLLTLRPELSQKGVSCFVKMGKTKHDASEQLFEAYHAHGTCVMLQMQLMATVKEISPSLRPSGIAVNCKCCLALADVASTRSSGPLPHTELQHLSNNRGLQLWQPR